MKLTVMIISVAGLILSSSVLAATIRVPSEQPTIQAGIDAAIDGDTVLVADGTYTGDGNRDINFKGKAITVTSENGAETCIIDCMGSRGRGFIFENHEDQISVIRGFTIKHGDAILGGGIACDNSSPTIINCIIANNTAIFGGGLELYRTSAVITDCIVCDNEAGFNGGGIYCGYSSSTITNCTVTNNIAYLGLSVGGVFCEKSMDLTIKNCLVWGNEPQEIAIVDSGIDTVIYNDVEGGFAGIGNIEADPLFVGGDPFDYHLSSQSPCIDAGTDRGASPTDLDGKQRPRGGGVDMGAYEYQSWPLTVRTYVKMPSHVIFPGDVTSCSASVWNPEYEAIEESPLFVILDIMGSYYFAPSFSSYDFFERRFPFGLTKLTILPEFAWPAGAGSVSNIVWYAFLSNHEQTELMSNIGVFDFSWSE